MNSSQWLSFAEHLPEAYFLVNSQCEIVEKNTPACSLLQHFHCDNISSLFDINDQQINELLHNIKQKKQLHTHFITNNKHGFQCYGSVLFNENNEMQFILRIIDEGNLSTPTTNTTDTSLKYAKALEALSSITAPLCGDEFLKVFVKHFARTLDAKFGLVSELNQPLDGKVHTLAFWQINDTGENFEYALEDTPCKEVYNKSIVYYDSDIQALFPKDTDLVNMGVTSYLGIPLLDSTNQPIGHICVLDDKPIDNNAFVQPILRIFAARAAAELERKSYQDKLLRSQGELERRVISRTKELEEKNRLLDKRAKEAKAATETKSKFLANMSHDIRTPLNGVMGMLDILNTTPLSSEQKYYVDTSLRSADSLLHLLNDILDLSRIESGKIELEFEQHEISDTIEDAATLMSSIAREKGLSIRCDISNIIGLFAKIDRHRTKQIIINLISNAIKFTSSGSIIVTAQLEGKEKNKRLAISVKDTGIGIPLEHEHSIFTPFTQIDSSTREGSGLGLSICKELASLMDGKIEYQAASDPAGSIFTLHLPLPNLKYIDSPSTEIKSKIIVIETGEKAEIIKHIFQKKGVSATFLSDVDDVPTHINDTQKMVFIISDSLQQDSLDESINTVEKILKKEKTTARMIILSDDIGKIIKRQKLLHTVVQTPVHHKELLGAIYDAQANISASETVSYEKHSESPLENTDLHVLVAEDNPVNQAVISKMLKKIGITAEIVENGQLALQQLMMKEYDLVIMDCQMPVMDGYDATQGIRKLNHKNANIPIIALTANNMHGDREKSLKSGMDDHLAKPVTIKSISEMIALWKDKTHKSATG